MQECSARTPGCRRCQFLVGGNFWDMRATGRRLGNPAAEQAEGPVAMVADAILDCTARGGIVLDAFLGSGTTVIAAERIGRRCCGVELDPVYVDTTIRRWQALTGEKAHHAATDRTFDDLAGEAEAADAA
jgi:hypothetical protein